MFIECLSIERSSGMVGEPERPARICHPEDLRGIGLAEAGQSQKRWHMQSLSHRFNPRVPELRISAGLIRSSHGPVNPYDLLAGIVTSHESLYS